MKPHQSFVLVAQEEIEEIKKTLKEIQQQLTIRDKNNEVLGDFIPEREAPELLNRRTTWFWQKRKSG